MSDGSTLTAVVQFLLLALMVIVVAVTAWKALSDISDGGPTSARDVLSTLAGGSVMLAVLSGIYLLSSSTGLLTGTGIFDITADESKSGEPPKTSTPTAADNYHQTNVDGLIQNQQTSPPKPPAEPADYTAVYVTVGVVLTAIVIIAVSYFAGRATLRRHRARKADRAALNELYTEALTIRDDLDAKYTAFEMDLEDVILKRPLLADTTDPVTARFYTAQAAMQDAFIRAGRRGSDTVQAALDAARAARTAWEAASTHALNHSLTPPAAAAPPASVSVIDSRKFARKSFFSSMLHKQEPSRTTEPATAAPTHDIDGINAKVDRVRALLTRIASEDASAREREVAIGKAAEILASLRKTSKIVEREAITSRIKVIDTRREIETPARKALTMGASA